MADPLSAISNSVLFEQPKLSKINNDKLCVLSTINLAREEFKNQRFLSVTQLQKILFLQYAEGHTLLPFRFSKHYFGPYSQELDNSIKDLTSEGLILIQEEKVIDFPKKALHLTQKGRTEITRNREEVIRIQNKIKYIMNKYSEYNARALEDYCYSK
jgi:uncharacterized protein YwgA